jgi:hypothetical protein
MLLTCGGLLSCSTPTPLCPGVRLLPLEVTVTDDATGLNICHATVVVTDGASTLSTDKNESALSDASCPPFFLWSVTTGTYTVSVTAADYQTGQVPNVRIELNSCGSAEETKVVSVKLVRAP